jgi:ribonuclease HI
MQTTELSGGVPKTTNNRMELMAVISALEAVRNHAELELFTDSQYVKNGIEMWIDDWKMNGWRTARKQPVANQDLWRRLDELVEKFRIHWAWVRGHDGDAMNERCDKLAYAAAVDLSQ